MGSGSSRSHKTETPRPSQPPTRHKIAAADNANNSNPNDTKDVKESKDTPSSPGASQCQDTNIDKHEQKPGKNNGKNQTNEKLENQNQRDSTKENEDIDKEIIVERESKTKKLGSEEEQKQETEQRQKIEEVHIIAKEQESLAEAAKALEETKKLQEKEKMEKELEEIKKEAERSQKMFDAALRVCCPLVNGEELYQRASPSVIRLLLQHAPPPSVCLTRLLTHLPALQILDVSHNHIGPQGFRAIMLAMCQNATITVLNISNNQTDTDSAESVGRLLGSNSTLSCLDVSGNYLGLDYFSRCVGPPLASNTSLKKLRCESVGSTDMSVLLACLLKNSTLQELNISHNELSDSYAAFSSLKQWLEASTCALQNLDLKNCGLQGPDLNKLGEAFQMNSTLTDLNVSGAKVSSSCCMLSFIATCVLSSHLSTLVADNIKADKVESSWKIATNPASGTKSSLHVLSLCGCALTDQLVKGLGSQLPTGTLTGLEELSLTNNSGLTPTGLNSLMQLLQTPEFPSSLKRLSWGLNESTALPALLAEHALPNLCYLNLRMARMSAAAVAALAPLLAPGRITTLVLDGIKLAGSKAFNELFVSSGLHALSVSGCQLVDADLQPLCAAIQAGIPLHMLKLSTNRLTDRHVEALVGALLATETHPLALIDYSNNNIEEDGARKLTELHSGSQKHTSSLHSLNVGNNNIAGEGLLALLGVVGESRLTALQAGSQQCAYDEEDMMPVFQQVARSLNMTVKETGGSVVAGCSPLSDPPPGLSIKLMGLGGCTGELGELLDSSAVCTDFQKKKVCSLTLQHALQIAAALKGYDRPDCLLSGEEWRHLVAAEKDAPSWLQLSESREKAVYFSGLPASVSVPKMEGVLEMEADCSVTEVYFCKDPMTRKNNGLGWALMTDAESVQKAVQYFLSGQAMVLGTAFVISPVNVRVDDSANSQAADSARRDMDVRTQQRHRDDTAHRALLQQSYEESQARHAYRLAHPAYADGRIW